MTTILAVESLDPDKAFKLRLEVYLRNNAIKVRALSKNPSKFDQYISDREKIIRDMVGECQISDKGNIVYP